MAHRGPIAGIVSGGQTGVDRAALDAALAHGLDCGGWCPRGRWAEDGPIAPRYPLRATPSALTHQRTRWNVRDSEATLVLLRRGRADRGTLDTVRLARRLGRPCRIADSGSGRSLAACLLWLRVHHVRALNVAGPRESSDPGIYGAAFDFMGRLLAARGARQRPCGPRSPAPSRLPRGAKPSAPLTSR